MPMTGISARRPAPGAADDRALFTPAASCFTHLTVLRSLGVHRARAVALRVSVGFGPCG
jgi:hypothetical protein